MCSSKIGERGNKIVECGFDVNKLFFTLSQDRRIATDIKYEQCNNVFNLYENSVKSKWFKKNFVACFQVDLVCSVIFNSLDTFR